LNEEFFAQKNIKKLRETFKTNTPFPHLVLEGLFSPKLLELMHSEFDNPKWNDWTHYDNTNERKLAVQSQLVLLGIDAEELWLLGPDSADVLVGREAAQGLQSLGEVVSRDECREMRPELRVALVVIPFDGRFLEGSVHAFDLTVRPRMIGFGQAMFDAVLLTCHVEHMRPKARSRTGSVVGQDRGDLVIRVHLGNPII